MIHTATAPAPGRAVLLAVQLPGTSDDELRSSLDEMSRLARTLGLEVVGRVTQRRTRLAPGAVVGAGKLAELAEWTGGSGVVSRGPGQSKRSRRHAVPDQHAEADEAGEAAGPDEPEAEGEEAQTRLRARIVLVDHDLTPSQARNLERATGAEVLDRTAVILAIFQRHARSREAKLQVEIARLSYLVPRLRETGGGADRQGGGIGGRGAGESSSELDRRKVRDRIAELRNELSHIEREAGTRRKRRGGRNTVALVGYTNAGKSTWMRALTGSGVLVRDELFATLDTTVRVLQPESTTRILVSDTVGFIKRLPHDLVASFRSTLDEARECELLIHVVDASDPAFEAQVAVTREVLESIGATESPRLVVLNKADRVDAAARERLAVEWPDAVVLSAKDPLDVDVLRDRIVAFFEREMVEAELVVPYARQRVVAEAHARGQVLEETHDAFGTRLRLRAAPDVVAHLRQVLAAG